MEAYSNTAAFDPPGRAGYLKLRRGAAEDGKPPGEPLWNYRRLIARVGGDAAWVWVELLDRAYGGEYVAADLGAMCGMFKRGEKWALYQLRRLVDAGILTEDPARPLHFKPHPERIAAAPDLVQAIAPGRGRKPMGHAGAAVLASADTAALVCEATTGAPVAPVEAGNIFPARAVDPLPPDPAPPEKVPCPICHGSGWVNPHEAEIYFQPGEMLILDSDSDFRPPENLFAFPSANRMKQTGFGRPKTFSKDVEQQAIPAGQMLASAELETLNAWVIRQPWAHVSNDRRRMLGDAEARPVIEAIHAEGYTVEQYVNWQIASGVTVSRDRENVTGLLISLIPRRRGRAYSARDRADDRSTDPPGKRGS